MVVVVVLIVVVAVVVLIVVVVVVVVVVGLTGQDVVDPLVVIRVGAVVCTR